jgi:hypothetical protein
LYSFELLSNFPSRHKTNSSRFLISAIPILSIVTETPKLFQEF